MHFNEYVPGSEVSQPLPKVSINQARQAAQTGDTTFLRGGPAGDVWDANTLRASSRARQGLGAAGFEGHDIRPGNMRVTPGGQTKVIDYVPGRQGELSSSPLTPHVIQANNDTGAALFNTGTEGPTSTQYRTTTKGLLGGMLGGNKPMGVRRQVTIAGRPAPSPSSLNQTNPVRNNRSSPVSMGGGAAPVASGVRTTPVQPPQPASTRPVQPPGTTPLKPPKTVAGLPPAPQI